MKIAVPLKKRMNGNYVVSPSFGKAPFFLVYETDDSSYEIVPNDFQNGRDILNLLSSKGVRVVITNHLGFNAYKKVIELGLIAYYTEKKNRDFMDVINDYEKGLLKEITPELLTQISAHKH